MKTFHKCPMDSTPYYYDAGHWFLMTPAGNVEIYDRTFIGNIRTAGKEITAEEAAVMLEKR